MQYEVLEPVEISNKIYMKGEVITDLSVFRPAPEATEENPEPLDEVESLIKSGHIKLVEA